MNREPSAMRRKAGAGRPAPEIGQITPARALRAAVAQAAQDVAALVAVGGNVEEGRLARDPLVDGLAEHALLALVEGPDSRFGLVVLDAQTVAALIEMQTTGRVVPRPAEPRAPTRTDAIMCADFIDRLLELVERRLAEAEAPLAPAFGGFRYAMALAEPRAVAMTLDDIPYRHLSLSVDFGHGAKSGGIALALPFDPAGRAARGRGEGAAFTEALRAQVMDTEVHLAATLARRRMTLAEVAGLEAGTIIPLPREVLSEIEIEDMRGRVVARGRLGQADGHRAVRLQAEGNAPAPGMTAALPMDRIAAATGPAAGDDALAGIGSPWPEQSDDGPPELPALDGLADLAGFSAADDTIVDAAGELG